MKKAIGLALFLTMVSCSKTPAPAVAVPAKVLNFNVLRPVDGTIIDGVLDFDAEASAREYKSAIAVSVDGQ